MDMQSGSLVHAFMNNHGWYQIETPLDYFRAALWCGANFVTAMVYFLIPNEIRHWGRAIPFSGITLITNLFIAFIAFCGASHIAMLFIMQTAPWWAIAFIYGPMAIVSVATVAVIRLRRRQIIDLIEAVARALTVKPL